MKTLARRFYGVGGVLPFLLVSIVACGGGGGSGGSAGSASGGNGGMGGATGGNGGMGGSGATGGGGTGGMGGGAACGNGVVDAQETCDTAIAGNAPGACPSACDDAVACTADTLKNGGTCTAACVHDPISTCTPGDGCCPAGCTYATDTDCSQTCGDGKVDANELCDTAILPGMPGACPESCGDGIACTSDTLLNAGTCSAQCAFANIVACVDGDGCCPLGCSNDSECNPLSRIKQTVITESAQTNWYRNGFWNGMAYTNWTSWNGQGMDQLIPGNGMGQTYRGIDYVVLADGRLKITMLQMDGTMAWARYATWDGNAYSNWTAWSNQFGNLTQIVPNQGTTQAYRSFDHVVLPDGRLKQTLLTWDGTKIWYRYGTWNGTSYATWTDWTDVSGTLTSLIPNQGTTQSFRSYNHVVFKDNRIKVALLTEDGRTVWYRYGTWDGTKYATWTDWANQYGNLTSLLPGQGTNQAYLAWDEATLGGAGTMSGCQNGCDDGDPCTTDACVANACTHVALSCDDGNLCTVDACVNGACQNSAKDCNDGDACTDDVCSAGTCLHPGKSCDDGNPCTDDACSSGACQHNNNTASCPGGTCQAGSCTPMMCSCNNCKDTCTGAACNNGAVCASNATCQNGTCACTTVFCGAAGCCGSGDTCSGGKCCPTPQSSICAGKCGMVNGPCGAVNCGGCAGSFTCCANTQMCDETCAP